MDKIRPQKDLLFSTPLLKVLDLLLQNPDVELTDLEVKCAGLNVMKSAINNSLRALAESGLIERRMVGRTAVNKLGKDLPVISHLKIVSNLLGIAPFVAKGKKHSYKMILFGSRADGFHTHESDYDLFIVSEEREKIAKIFSSFKHPIQLIIKSPKEYMGFADQEPALSNELAKGIVLWEKQ